MPVSRCPDPLWPATSILEWDAKGRRAVRALMALLSSDFRRGVSGMAGFCVGRIAVTEHISGPAAHESRTRAGGRREGHPDPGVASGGRRIASWTVVLPSHLRRGHRWAGRASSTWGGKKSDLLRAAPGGLQQDHPCLSRGGPRNCHHVRSLGNMDGTRATGPWVRKGSSHLTLVCHRLAVGSGSSMRNN
jgi:hypothetical protein